MVRPWNNWTWTYIIKKYSIGLGLRDEHVEVWEAGAGKTSGSVGFPSGLHPRSKGPLLISYLYLSDMHIKLWDLIKL